MKICSISYKFTKLGSKFCSIQNKPKKNGEFSPNLVTLTEADILIRFNYNETWAMVVVVVL